ncbi:MAG: Vitamin B12 dependent methionine synthase activation subunit, partial [Anaerotignum sp.]|nr:Vitamin B12 dependent methionine synthase activation subunit [Anaerotignum sp.]
QRLRGCNSALVFGATIGIEIDRLISKYGRISPSKALFFQAIGAERIESLCDVFCHDISYTLKTEGLHLLPRFSPGYGDFPLDFQKDIFRALDCYRKIGLSLNESMLMSPSKSVTAIAGISHNPRKNTDKKCSICTKTDCFFRSNK